MALAQQPSATNRRAAGVTDGLNVAGVLLTGGASRRMGFDKALVEVNGVPSAVRLAAALAEVTRPVFEVGPGRSGLPAVDEGTLGQGPLVAACAALPALRAAGHLGPVLLLACDLAFVTAADLALLARWPGRRQWSRWPRGVLSRCAPAGRRRICSPPVCSCRRASGR